MQSENFTTAQPENSVIVQQHITKIGKRHGIESKTDRHT